MTTPLPQTAVAVLLHPNNRGVFRTLLGCTIAMFTLPILAIYLVHSTNLILPSDTDTKTRTMWAGFSALGCAVCVMISVVVLAIYEPDPAGPAKPKPTPKPKETKFIDPTKLKQK